MLVLPHVCDTVLQGILFKLERIELLVDCRTSVDKVTCVGWDLLFEVDENGSDVFDSVLLWLVVHVGLMCGTFNESEGETVDDWSLARYTEFVMLLTTEAPC